MRGSQHYTRRACARVRTCEPLPFGYGIKREAVRLHLEGTNFRRTGRVRFKRCTVY
jgi:hypothetical protein